MNQMPQILAELKLDELEHAPFRISTSILSTIHLTDLHIRTCSREAFDLSQSWSLGTESSEEVTPSHLLQD
jgi:hypothetical protein